jgi:hypothetical protein
MVVGQAGLGTKSDCAGEGQQQFTWPNATKTTEVSFLRYVSGHTFKG